MTASEESREQNNSLILNESLRINGSFPPVHLPIWSAKRTQEKYTPWIAYRGKYLAYLS